MDKVHDANDLKYGILVRQDEGKRPLKRPGHSKEDNTKVEIEEIVCDHTDWIYVAEDSIQWQTVVNMVMNLPYP